MSIEQEIMIEILDDYLENLCQDIVNSNNLRLIDWEQGQIGGMLVASRISGLLPREATYVLQEAIDAWYEYATKREAA